MPASAITLFSLSDLVHLTAETPLFKVVGLWLVLTALMPLFYLLIARLPRVATVFQSRTALVSLLISSSAPQQYFASFVNTPKL